jgi:competence protein ComEA
MIDPPTFPDTTGPALQASSGNPTGGRSAAPSARPTFSQRFGQLLWHRTTAKVAAVLLAAGVLGAIGILATVRVSQGTPLPLMPMLGAVTHGSPWLAGDPPHEALVSAREDPINTHTAATRTNAPTPSTSHQSEAMPQPASSEGVPSSTTSETPCKPEKDTSALGSGITADGKIILNTASAEELTRLPGVGAKRARDIVALRQRLKRFRKFSELLRVRGIGVKSLKKLIPHLVLDPPPSEPGESNTRDGKS